MSEKTIQIYRKHIEKFESDIKELNIFQVRKAKEIYKKIRYFENLIQEEENKRK